MSNKVLNILSESGGEERTGWGGSDRNKSCGGGRGVEGDGARGLGGLTHLTLTQIMIIMLAGSERLDTSIVYESPQSCAQFPLL